jgi:putative transposase
VKKSRFTEEQIVRAIHDHDGGKKAEEICRELGISQASFYAWKKQYAGLGIAELRELRQLREENARLKTIVADLTLDRQILQEALSKKA